MDSHLNSTNHGTFNSFLHSLDPTVTDGACCVPTSLKPLHLLYLDQDDRVSFFWNTGNKIILGLRFLFNPHAVGIDRKDIQKCKILNDATLFIQNSVIVTRHFAIISYPLNFRNISRECVITIFIEIIFR